MKTYQITFFTELSDLLKKHNAEISLPPIDGEIEVYFKGGETVKSNCWKLTPHSIDKFILTK